MTPGTPLSHRHPAVRRACPRHRGGVEAEDAAPPGALDPATGVQRLRARWWQPRPSTPRPCSMTAASSSWEVATGSHRPNSGIRPADVRGNRRRWRMTAPGMRPPCSTTAASSSRAARPPRSCGTPRQALRARRHLLGSPGRAHGHAPRGRQRPRHRGHGRGDLRRGPVATVETWDPETLTFTLPARWPSLAPDTPPRCCPTAGCSSPAGTSSHRRRSGSGGRLVLAGWPDGGCPRRPHGDPPRRWPRPRGWWVPGGHGRGHAAIASTESGTRWSGRRRAPTGTGRRPFARSPWVERRSSCPAEWATDGEATGGGGRLDYHLRDRAGEADITALPWLDIAEVNHDARSAGST